MRTLPLKLMTALSSAAAAVSLAAWWGLRDVAYAVAGIASFLIMLVLCGVWVYRQVAIVMDRLDRAATQNDALLRQALKTDKQQARAIQALATGQDELLRLQSDGATVQQQLAKKLATVEEAARSASRQAGDSQELALRAFRDVSAMQTDFSIATADRLQLVLQSLQELAHLHGDLASGQAEQLPAVAKSNELLGKVLDETTALEAMLSPFVATSEKLARQILREAKSAQSTLDERLVHVHQVIENIASGQAEQLPTVAKSNELLGKVLDETTALEAMLSPFVATSEKLVRQILREAKSAQSTLDERLVRVHQVIENIATGQAEQLPAVAKSNELLGKVLDETTALETTLSPFVATSEKLSQKILRTVVSGQTKLPSLLGKAQYETVQEIEALVQLRRLFDVQEPAPLLGGFAMQPVSMLTLIEEVLARKPGLMVECGSGTSTLWIARALARNGKGRLVSLEHLEEYFEKTSRSLQQHGLEQWVDLRLAPLQEMDVNGEPFQWYDLAAVADLTNIEILSVDGPPGFTGPLARYPALPVLCEKLATDALILVDDADREDEQAVMERWKVEIGGIWKAWKIAGRTQALAFRRSRDG